MPDTEQISEALRQIDLFDGLPDEDLQKYAGLMQVEDRKKDEFLIVEGQKGNHIYIILSGELEVSVYLSPQNEMKRVAKIGGGHVLGELALLGMERRSASVRVLRDCRYLSVGADAISALFVDDQALGFRFMTRLASILAGRMVSTTKSLSNAWYAVSLSGGMGDRSA